MKLIFKPSPTILVQRGQSRRFDEKEGFSLISSKIIYGDFRPQLKIGSATSTPPPRREMTELSLCILSFRYFLQVQRWYEVVYRSS